MTRLLAQGDSAVNVLLAVPADDNTLTWLYVNQLALATLFDSLKA